MLLKNKWKDFWKNWGIPIVLVLASSCILSMAVSAAHKVCLQQGIAEAVLRFHVLANSDSEEDQRIKYQVRDEVIAWLSEQMGAEGEAPEDREAVLQFIEENLDRIEQAANRALAGQGAGYRASAALEDCYFPERTYGSCTFPAGWYKALRICLGDAEGQNWWCVLYPKLCFSDCLHAVVGEEQMQELEEVLTVEEYESLLDSPGEWKIAFRWF